MEPNTGLVETLGLLCKNLVTFPSGKYSARAEISVPEGPSDAEVPRRFAAYLPDTPPPSGVMRLQHDLVLVAWDEWRVDRYGELTGVIERNGEEIRLDFGGRNRSKMEVDSVKDEVTTWSYWTQDWMAEMIQPHRLLGLLDSVQLVEDGEEEDGVVRLRGTPSSRQSATYSGIVPEQVLQVDLVANVDQGMLLEAIATHWNHRTDVYNLTMVE